jgi:hypothetical protein
MAKKEGGSETRPYGRFDGVVVTDGQAGEALRFGTAESQDESHCSAIHKQPYRSFA